MPRPFVLVVDDEDSNRNVCRDALELDGYQVLVATCAEEAIEILSVREVDAVVCDVSMPHNGVRLYEYLLEHRPELRGHFIFITGSQEKKQQVERLPQVARCLLKPFSIRLLLETMRAALAG